MGSLFGRLGSGQSRTSGAAPGFGHGPHSNNGDLLSHSLLGSLGKQPHDQQQQQHRLLMEHKHSQNSVGGDGFSVKDWQGGLRALLPNVNVSFGSNNQQGHQGQQQQQQYGQHNFHHNNLPQHTHHQHRLQQNQSNWDNVSTGFGNDWTMLDPSIVSGQMAAHPDLTRPVPGGGDPLAAARHGLGAHPPQRAGPSGGVAPRLDHGQPGAADRRPRAGG